MQLYWKQLAASYDCNTYGSGTYDNASCATATDTGNGGLVATGENMTAGLIGGVLLIALAIVLFVRLRRSKKATK